MHFANLNAGAHSWILFLKLFRKQMHMLVNLSSRICQPKAKHRHRRNVMSYRFTSLLFVSRHFFLFLVISFCFTSFLFVSRHFFLFHVISFCFTPFLYTVFLSSFLTISFAIVVNAVQCHTYS